MSNLIFSQVVASYLNSWEGHTQIEGDNYVRVRDQLSMVTIDELTTEYNALTQQNLWNDSLINLFFDELRDRILGETFFSISTSWKSIDDWLKHPFVLIRASFEELYPTTEGISSFILEEDPTLSTLTLMNNFFPDEIQDKIIRLLLNREINVIVRLIPETGKIEIIGLENSYDLDDRIYFSSIREPAYSIKAVLREASDWNFYCRMYSALKSSKPEVLDPMEDKLINQLIDVDQIRDLIENGGSMIEGDRIIEVGKSDDE